MNRKLKVTLVLLLILIIATFFRFWKITEIPPGLYPDEAMNGNNALEALKSGQFKLFYPENNGREGLFINLQAISVAIFGNQPWTLRLVSGIFGVLTVLGLFFLVRELFRKKSESQSERLALFSAFLLSVSFWHVNFSRIGFRAIMVPFCLVWCFALLFIALRTKKIVPAIASGIFFGLGFHTYIAFRFTPLLALIPIFFGRYFNNNPENKTDKSHWKIFAIWLIATFIVALPIGLYFLKNPGDFFGRTGQVSIFQQSSPVLSFLKSLGKTLLMFNVAGDCNWRHNLACWPQLEPLTGLSFLLGIAWLIKNLIKRNSDKFIGLFILTWLFAMSLPSILTSEGLPHALRSIGLIPVAFILAGLGLNSLWEWLEKKFKNKTAAHFIVFSILGIIMIFEGWRYFSLWAKNNNVAGAFDQSFVQISRYLNEQSNAINKYVLVNTGGVLVKGLPMSSQTTMFLTNTYLETEQKTKKIFYLLPGNISALEKNEPFLLIPLENNEETKLNIQNYFSNASLEEKEGFGVFENF
ncbi:MAG TPA: glycosyltransferase family 39 protein [Candidatus Paceibacterota bacterium]|nr:glycosyltransferase family 39 protein [Candidatus Paceibacterota bacterium]